MNNLQPISDRDIALVLEDELLANEGVSAHLLDVQVNNGIVILSGSVDTLHGKAQAGEIAETIRGVRAVVNQVEVKPVTRTDQELRQDISKALLIDPTMQTDLIDIAVREAIVTLTGTVESWQRKELVEWLVQDIKGIKAIKNQITVARKTSRSDHDLKAEIERRLEFDVWVDDTLIEVRVSDGHVALSGTVSSAAEKTRTYFDAWVGGVAAVDSRDLGVEPQTQPDMRQENRFALRSDEAVKEAIEDALRYDPRIIAASPEVEVNKGAVVLRGVVGNLMAKKAAEQDANNTIGVWRVKNHLKVRPVDPPSDIEVAESVRKALLWNPSVDRHQVVVSCRNGKVYLYGAVSSNHEKFRAEQVAYRVYGVVDIENNLRVDQVWRWKSDEEIAQNIQNRFQWSPFINADQIDVAVQKAEATLTGTVDSWQKRKLLVDHALKGGAKNVVSRLEIRYRGGQN